MRYFLYCWICINALFAKVVERKEPAEFSTTIAIPCHHLHAHFLMRTCLAYANQTVLPDEVVISLSGTKHLDKELILDLESRQWPFKLKVIQSEESQTEAQNRNSAAANASKDILINHDADDLPHPQRVEIIKHFFSKYDIVHLMHSALHPSEEVSPYENFDEINYHILWRYADTLNKKTSFCGGPIAMLRSVFERFQWKESTRNIGCDVSFNKQVIKGYWKSIAIEAPIYIYFYNAGSLYLNHFRKVKDGKVIYVPF